MTDPTGSYNSSKRHYRHALCPAGMQSFTVAVKETDLWVAVEAGADPHRLAEGLENHIWRRRVSLDNYLKEDTLFRTTLVPHLTRPGAPSLAVEMARAGNRAGVGPMAAVAGAFAQLAGEWLLEQTSQVIVENGGDIFFCCRQPVRVGVYAGSSPFSNRLAVEVKSPPGGGRGICTSSATVGPSYSGGRADAAVIFAADALLADAAATATANLVQTPGDLEKAVHFALNLAGVEGALVIIGDKLAARGHIQLKTIK